MTLLKKSLLGLVAIVSIVAMAAFAVLLMHGFVVTKSSFKSNKGVNSTVNSGAEAKKIKPTAEMAQFYNMIKSADRLIIIEGGSDKSIDRRDQIPLSVFYSYEPKYWEIVGAVASAKKRAGTGDGENEYTIRWYGKGYKEVGEAEIDNSTGSITIRYLPVTSNKRTENKGIFIPKDKLIVIDDAALIHKQAPEGTPI